jgi:hypothetical protein
MSENKVIEKKVARIVKSELDKSNYEDTAWLKAFKEARGDKNQARAIYVGIRSKDLEDEFYEEISRIEEEKIEKQNKIEQEKAAREYRLEQLRLKKEELKQSRKRRESEKSSSTRSSSSSEKLSYSSPSSANDSFLENNIKPFFRGEYELSFSYWYVGFLLTILFSLPNIIIEASKTEPTGFGAFVYVIYSLALVIYIIFAYTGIWRSAGFYVIEKNKKNENGFWGYAARLSVILGYIQMITAFVKEFSK